MNLKEILLILSPGFASSEDDTTCLPMQQEFVRIMKKEFPHLQIIVLAFQYPYHTKAYSWEGSEIIPFNGQNRGGLKRLFLRKKIYAELERINQSGRIIGIISYWYGECAVIGNRFGEKHCITHRCWISGQDAKKQNRYPGKNPLPGTELVALSDFLQDEFEKNHGTRPSSVIPPVVPLPEQINLHRDIDIIGAGSLIPLKQFDLFIKLIAELKKDIPTMRAVLIGDGPQKEYLQSLSIGAGLKECLTFTGGLPYPEVLQFMNRSKLLLHTSSYEGFSGVCLEALSRGCTVISFCKPMKEGIENWEVAETGNEMKNKTLKILESFNVMPHPVIPFPPGETVRKFMGQFLMQKA